MMRRLFALGLVALAVLSRPARAQQITAAPGGEMSSLVSVPFDVPIYVDLTQRTEKLGSFALRMTWDTTVLKWVSGGNGTFGAVTVNADSLGRGVLRLSGANPAGVGGMVTVGIAHFMPVAAQPDTLRLAVTELYAAGTFADLTPSLVVKNAAFCPARGMYGDIDKDGAINSRDALIALSNAVGLDVSAYDVTLGDVDASGTTNARDALIIVSYAVGLNMSGFRVDRIAGGACAANLPLVMAILPDTVDLEIGQKVAFEARAADSSGVLKTVTNAIWSSSNSGVLAMYPDGSGLARDTGSVWVTAIRGTVDSARALVRIVAHHAHLYVDAAAANARNQLGTLAFPYGTIGQATAVTEDGDTIEVRVARYPEYVDLSGAVLLMGDTLADGTRPQLVVDTNNVYGTGLTLLGPGAQEVRNLAIDGYYDAVEVMGASTAVLANLKTTNVTNGVVVVDSVALLRITGSHLFGETTNRYGYGVETNATARTLVVQGTEISDFEYGGIYADYADSVAVLGSHIHDINDGDAVYVSYSCDCAPPAQRAGPARASVLLGPTPALVVDSSTIERAPYDYLIYLGSARSASITNSRLLNNPQNQGGYGVYLYGASAGWLRLANDSVNVSNDWLRGWYFDSLTVDSTVVVSPSPAGYTYDVPNVRIWHTQILGSTGAQALEVSFGGVGPNDGGLLRLHSVTVVGDPSCNGCADAFDVYGARTVADSLLLVNIDDGLYSDADSGLTVTNSVFRHVWYPIDWDGSTADTTVQVTVKHSLFDQFSEAIYSYRFGVVVDSNTFQGGEDEGVYVSNAYGPVWVTNNRFTSVPYPVYMYRSAAIGNADSVTDNVIADLTDQGIYVEEDTLARMRVLRNTIACNSLGAGYGYGVEFLYTSGVMANNLVTGCYAGLWSLGYYPRIVDTISGNTVTMPPNPYVGIYAFGTLATVVSGNTVSGPATGSPYYGDIWVDDNSYSTGTALVTGNAVSGGGTVGINVSNLDSAFVTLNTVQGVGNGGTGITVGNQLSKAAVYGNAVRHVSGVGLAVDNADTSLVTVDSNVVEGAGLQGIRVGYGATRITRTRVTSSGSNGVEFDASGDTARTSLRNSFIAGNRFGLQAAGYPFHADNNWWGNPAGPSCYASDTACTGPAGDSVSAGLIFKPFLTDTSTLVVPAAPRAFALASVAARAPAISGPARVATLPPRSTAVRQAPRAAQALAARPPAADRPPAGVSAARRRGWERAQQLRSAEARARAQREAADQAEQAARAAARQAREQQREQRMADQAAHQKAERERAQGASRRQAVRP